MITVYKIKEDGSLIDLQIEESKLQIYLNDGWTTEKPADIVSGVKSISERAGVDIDFGVNPPGSPSPYGYPSLINTGNVNEKGEPIFQDVNVYLQGINKNGSWYYPGDEDRVLDGMSTQNIRTLQDRLVRTQWFSMENYTQEYGRPGRETRNALIKAMTASNFASAVGS